MRLINLMDDTRGDSRCISEHGLSFYLETEKHCYLLDFGASETMVRTAQALGIDLEKVDIGILSHGHYDHAGGILPFSKINSTAELYMQKSAGAGHYQTAGQKIRYVGIDLEILTLPQVRLLDGNHVICQEAELFTHIAGSRLKARGNRTLMCKINGRLVPDAFVHEQCAVIHTRGGDILFSGCAHNGIINILEEYRSLYGKDPSVVISGFHLSQKDGYEAMDYALFEEIAKELKQYHATIYTGHCTGQEAFDTMKPILGEQLHAVSCGLGVNL